MIAEFAYASSRATYTRLKIGEAFSTFWSIFYVFTEMRQNVVPHKFEFI